MRRQAMFVDFGMAEQYGGDCYLRFDDTNPEAEKREFIDHIQEIVAWLGWKPAKVGIYALGILHGFSGNHKRSHVPSGNRI